MNGRIRRIEIGCKDKERTAAFYRAVAGWDIGEDFHIATGPDSPPGYINSLGHEPHHYVTFYIEVDDVEAALSRCRARGGSTLVGPVPLPHGRGRFAWVGDPDGNIVGLWEDHPDTTHAEPG